MDRFHKVCIAQFNKATKEPHELLKFAIKPNASNIWYVMLTNFSGDNDEYAFGHDNKSYGEYLVRIELPDKFPFEPPHFYFMTPNGVYDCEKKVCVSIGEYHKDQYRATLGVPGFCNQLVSGLIGWKTLGGGINIIETTIDKKKKYAADSCAYNLKHNESIVKLINNTYAEYSQKFVKQNTGASQAESASMPTIPKDSQLNSK